MVDMADAPLSPNALETEPDAVAIFQLLYPMLSDREKLSSEAMRALRIVSKYLPENTVEFMWKHLERQFPSRALCR
jgi:hypothetical protein